MNQYPIRYDKALNVVLAIILPPLTIIPLLIGVAVWLPNLPEWALISLIFVMLGATILLTLYMVKRVNPQGVVTLTDDGLVVEFPNRTLFTPSSFEIKTREITNFYVLENQDNYSMCFATSVAPPKFNLSNASTKDEDKESFAELMAAVVTMINDYNEGKATPHNRSIPTPEVNSKPEPQAEPQPAITNISIYQRGWMKTIMVVSTVVIIAATTINIVAEFADSPGAIMVVLVLAAAVFMIYKLRKRKKSD